MEGRNVVSQTSVIYFVNQSSLLSSIRKEEEEEEQTLINRCLFNIPNYLLLNYSPSLATRQLCGQFIC